MPRIRQYAQKYADEDFWREIQSRKALVGISTDKELAEAMGLSASSFCKRKKDAAGLTVSDLRRFVGALKNNPPNPEIVLKLIGYSQKDIQKFLKEDNRNEQCRKC